MSQVIMDVAENDGEFIIIWDNGMFEYVSEERYNECKEALNKED